MSVGYLVKTNPTKIPMHIASDENVSISVISDMYATYSSEPKSLDTFDLSTIRISMGDKIDPVTATERKIVQLKIKDYQRMILAAAMLFLSISIRKTTRIIVLVLKFECPEFIRKISDFFPEQTIVVDNGTFSDSTGGGAECVLISLDRDLITHENAVRKHSPVWALFAAKARSKTPFNFYYGEAWLPPFAGKDPSTYFIRSKCTTTAIWESSLIYDAITKFRFVTNESVAYLNPDNGTDSYLCGKYENDYSNLFAYAAAYYYKTRLSKTVAISEVLEILIG